jgi:hypothetical protein
LIGSCPPPTGAGIRDAAIPQGDSASEPERPEADATDALALRFPERAWRIGRLQAEVARLRAICEDYDEARRALVYWLTAGQTGVTRAEEYRQIVAQLRAEASAALSAYESRRS